MVLHKKRSIKRQPSVSQLESASNDLVSTRVQARTAGAQGLAALAVGALAIGALAVGALAIGRLVIGRARIRRLRIDELVVGKLRVTDSVETPGTSRTESDSAS